MHIVYYMPIKSKYIKDIGEEIWTNYESSVSGEFDQNKTLVNNVTNLESKRVRNKVAGYLSRLYVINTQTESNVEHSE